MPDTKPADDRIGVFRLVFGFLWLALVVLVPAIGVWAGSSLAAYRNGPVWLVCLAGLLLFPVLPLLWEARARRKSSGRTHFLTFTDRIVLRTLVLNLAFLGVLLGVFPAVTFAALSTRGDWFLDGKSGPRVDAARAQLFQASAGLEWLYRKARKNPYRDSVDPASRVAPAVHPEPAPVERVKEDRSPLTAVEPNAPEESRDPHAWPFPATLHPLVAHLPAEAETSFLSVARYIDANEKDPWLRLKALHDYVADRIVYDVAGYHARSRPPQDAETVFRTRTAVCAGYANLLAAMGNAIGEEIRVVSGDARLESSDLTGEGHAWNAAKLEGRWVLIDATWDAGNVGASGFTKDFDTQYLFVPPEVFGVTHFPDDAAWQLRAPLSRGEFFRQPVLRAGFFADGLTLLSPDRSQVTVGREVSMSLRNPRGRSLLAHLEPHERGAPTDCRVTLGASAQVDCILPASGRFRLELFSAPEASVTHHLVAEIEVNGSGS